MFLDSLIGACDTISTGSRGSLRLSCFHYETNFQPQYLEGSGCVKNDLHIFEDFPSCRSVSWKRGNSSYNPWNTLQPEVEIWEGGVPPAREEEEYGVDEGLSDECRGDVGMWGLLTDLGRKDLNRLIAGPLSRSQWGLLLEFGIGS